jgi:hypothetical protein
MPAGAGHAHQRMRRPGSRRDRCAGPSDVTVLEADAGRTDSYLGYVPADVVLLCGIFGNVLDADIRRTIEHASSLSAAGATVIWTRHRQRPDLTYAIRDWWTESGFQEIAFDSPPMSHSPWACRDSRVLPRPAGQAYGCSPSHSSPVAIGLAETAEARVRLQEASIHGTGRQGEHPGGQVHAQDVEPGLGEPCSVPGRAAARPSRSSPAEVTFYSAGVGSSSAVGSPRSN